MQLKEQFSYILESYSNEIQNITNLTRDFVYEVFPEVVERVWLKQKIAGYGTGLQKISNIFVG